MPLLNENTLTVTPSAHYALGKWGELKWTKTNSQMVNTLSHRMMVICRRGGGGVKNKHTTHIYKYKKERQHMQQPTHTQTQELCRHTHTWIVQAHTHELCRHAHMSCAGIHTHTDTWVVQAHTHTQICAGTHTRFVQAHTQTQELCRHTHTHRSCAGTHTQTHELCRHTHTHTHELCRHTHTHTQPYLRNSLMPFSLNCPLRRENFIFLVFTAARAWKTYNEIMACHKSDLKLDTDTNNKTTQAHMQKC